MTDNNFKTFAETQAEAERMIAEHTIGAGHVLMRANGVLVPFKKNPSIGEIAIPGGSGCALNVNVDSIMRELMEETTLYKRVLSRRAQAQRNKAERKAKKAARRAQ